MVPQCSQIPELLHEGKTISPINSGVAAPGTQLLWKGNSLPSPSAERDSVPSTS